MLFLFTAPATTEIYTLSLHDALPICAPAGFVDVIGGFHGPEIYPPAPPCCTAFCTRKVPRCDSWARIAARHFSRAKRSEEHTSELQSRRDLVCRLLLEKKNKRALVCK